jgi:hypothetical protein
MVGANCTRQARRDLGLPPRSRIAEPHSASRVIPPITDAQHWRQQTTVTHFQDMIVRGIVPSNTALVK